MMLSIVTTVYNSSEYLTEFYQRVVDSSSKITDDFEIVFVNDGSPDDSIDIIKRLVSSDVRVKLIDLSRNYGHHPAMMVGLSFAKGEKVFLIDCDLEEPPELLSQFNQLMTENHVDVVYGIQATRKGKFFERISGAIFYTVINFMSTIKVPNNVLTVRLMTRKFVRELDGFQEKVVFAHGILASLGFAQLAFPVVKLDKGSTSYSLGKKLKLASDSITSFSSKPLRYVFGLGLITSLVSISYFIFIVFKALFLHSSVEGWASVIASIWLFGGLSLLSIGIVGAYTGRIFTEVKARPRVIVKDVIYGKQNLSQGNNTEKISSEN